jgi:hypothetical protein
MPRQEDKTLVTVHLKEVAFKITYLHVWFLVLLMDEAKSGFNCWIARTYKYCAFINFSGEGK